MNILYIISGVIIAGIIFKKPNSSAHCVNVPDGNDIILAGGIILISGVIIGKCISYFV